MGKTLFEKNIQLGLPAVRVRHVFVFISLLVLTFLIYANSLHGDWIFDDGPNIVENVNVHLKTLSWKGIGKTFFIAGQFSRPLSYLSFALNHYWGGLNVFGYHLVNILIHFITAFLLFSVIERTLNLPRLKERYACCAHTIALLAAVLWAVNPLQVLAVSYIVQRMTALAGMFYLLSLYCYIRGRTEDSSRWNAVFFILSFLSFLLALGSKENAAMLPVIIFVYDLVFIQCISKAHIKRNMTIVLAPLLVLLSLAILYTDMSAILGGYAERPFTLTERLLTEPRVVVFYLSLLFYPLPSRLAMFHDITLSKSLIDPWTTLAAIALILAVTVYALFRAGRHPLVSFAILFFFMNHLIEGTIIPLELIYEHRNYIPSMFLFVPVVLLFITVMDRFSRSRTLQFLLLLLILAVIVSQGHTVYMRNQVIGHDLTLWLDNVQKAPHLSRIHNNLGKSYMDIGLLSEAMREFERALKTDSFHRPRWKAVVECNIGHLFIRKGEYDRAFSHFTTALHQYPGFSVALSGIAIVELRRGHALKSLDFITQALRRRPDSVLYKEFLSIVLLKLDKGREAFLLAQDIIQRNPGRIIPRAVMAEFFRKQGRINQSIMHWEYVATTDPRNPVPYLVLMSLFDQSGDFRRLDHTYWKLITLKGNRPLESFLEKAHREMVALVHLPDRHNVYSIITHSLYRQAQRVE